MKRRSRFALSIATLLVAAGTASAQPFQFEYDVSVVSPGLYQYEFKVTLDPTVPGSTWTPGMGWNWFCFGVGRRSAFLPTSPAFLVTHPSPFNSSNPVGPWYEITSVGGGHNGPMFGPITVPNSNPSVQNFWIPQAVGEQLVWRGNSPVYLPEGHVLFSSVVHTSASSNPPGPTPQTINFKAANRVVTGAAAIGSCCLADGSCITVNDASCTIAGGVYGGDNTSCATTNCFTVIPTGACCRDSGCVITTAAKCTNTGGVYAGDNIPCGSAGCAPVAANTVAAPDFVASSRVWTYAPSHSVTISGGSFRATGFRLKANMERAIEGFQSDMLMELVAPNGTTLLIGGDSTNPLVANSYRWANLRLSGTGPATNNNAGSIDGTYSWDFGPVDGNWTINFWNNYAHTASPNVPPEHRWNNITVELLNAGSGACCLPDGTCIDTAIGNCTMLQGAYKGDNSTCGTCNVFLPTLPIGVTPSNLTNLGGGIFLDLVPAKSLSIAGFDYYSTAAAGTPTTVEVWTKPGTYFGNDADPAAWTLHETINSVAGGTAPALTSPLMLTTPLNVAGGETRGVYLVAQSGGLRYHGSGNTQFDSSLLMFSDRTRTAPFAGTMNAFRTFAGRIYYTPTCVGACPFLLYTPPATSTVSANNNGIFLDLTASSEIDVKRLEFYSGVANGTAMSVDVYTKSGSYLGFEGDPSAWTLVGTFPGISGAADFPVVIDIPDFVMQPGETVGMYIFGTTGGYRFRPATSPDPVADDHLSISSNHGRAGLFTGTLSASRRFGGRVHYTTGGTAPCYANCDGSTTPPILNVADFGCFLSKFAAGDNYANCDGSTIPPVLNVADFGCFLTKFAAGCP